MDHAVRGSEPGTQCGREFRLIPVRAAGLHEADDLPHPLHGVEGQIAVESSCFRSPGLAKDLGMKECRHIHGESCAHQQVRGGRIRKVARIETSHSQLKDPLRVIVGNLIVPIEVVSRASPFRLHPCQ